MTRILWNQRGVEIDEIVIDDVSTVHVEQMHDGCWWMAVYRSDGTYWMGNFIAQTRKRMTFIEQENNGIDWKVDQTHEVAS